MKFKNNTWLIIASFFAIYIFWGATYLFNKVGVMQEIPPFLWVGIRFVIAGILLFIIAHFSKNTLPSRSEIKNAIIAGILLITLGNGLLVWVLKYVDSGFVAMAFASQPLIILLLMRLLYRKRIQTKSWVGIFLGVLGMYLLINQGSLNILHQQKWVLAVLLCSITAWSLGLIFVSRTKSKNSHNTFYWVSGVQMFSAGSILLLISLLIEKPNFNELNINTDVIVSMLFLIIFGSLIAYLAFNYLLKYVAPHKVSTQALVNPIVAVLLGAIFLKEEFTMQSVIASTILLTGSYFINSTKNEPDYKEK
ncbi:MAG: EamA family transporter [Polaribacter sp.]|uniref:EamA family transporter n=1 Tax=Polaribacter sp. TaxID=1920175 RepID=UPI002F35ADB1